MAYQDLREYLAALDKLGKLHRVKKEVDPGWEVAAVMRRVFQRIPPARRPAMMFERVKGHDMPLVAGVLGPCRRSTRWRSRRRWTRSPTSGPRRRPGPSRPSW